MAFFALSTSLFCAALVCRRRLVWRLGPYGPALAPAFLLIVWFAFLRLGEWGGSLAAMAWAAAAPMGLIAAAAAAWTKPRRLRPFHWSWSDEACFFLLAYLFFAMDGQDVYCHFSVVSAYTRGNIPPSALNSPDFPLMYHSSFDAAAAVISQALGLHPELALDVVSVVCLFALIGCLQALSRALFAGTRAQQAARLFFLVGFGPVYIRLLLGGGHWLPWAFMRGYSTQSFAEAVMRRPMGLNAVIFCFLLAALLPRFPSRACVEKKDRAAPPAALLVCAFLLPQTSEELSLFATLLVSWAVLSGRLGMRWLAAWLLLLCASLPFSGIIRGMLAADPPSMIPRLGLGTPTLPSWEAPAPQAAFPLLSWKAWLTMLLEWGPFFFAALALAARDERRRLLVGIFAVGLAIACAFNLGPWPKSDLDRFLFYGTWGGFMLTAVWIEKLESAWSRAALSKRAAFALGTALAAFSVAGPIGLSLHRIMNFPKFAYEIDVTELRRALAVVGPKEQILSDAGYSQELMLAGFVVAAPMKANLVGHVDVARFDSYLEERTDLRPSWLFLPKADARLKGYAPAAEYKGYVLSRRS